MISVNEARFLLAESIKSMPREENRDLAQANNYILAQNIYSPTDTPNFDQSNMDGYAIKYAPERLTFALVATVQAAGEATEYELKAAEAMRIFTGAPLPKNADTVVMQEYCAVENGQLKIASSHYKKGAHVRPKASQNRKGDILLTAGTKLNPAAIGYLAMHGIGQVVVQKKPVIGLIIGGDELISANESIKNGQVYEANSFALRALWAQYGIEVLPTVFVSDSVAAIEAGLQKIAKDADIIVVSGGASVGDFDFTVGALTNFGVEQVFHKVKQKPGKPLYLGKQSDANKLYFALPGNPTSALVCAYQYIIRAVELAQKTTAAATKKDFILSHNYQKAAGLTHFVRGIVDFEAKTVQILANQDSFRLDAFAQANALIELAAEQTDFAAGESVPVLLLAPNNF
jgi:molybdopterin molybdotransferase